MTFRPILYSFESNAMHLYCEHLERDRDTNTVQLTDWNWKAA